MMMQMEKLVSHCDMELMKMAMLRHEETFRQQVHELHRLYRVQRQLMMMNGMTGPSCRRQQRRRQPPRRVLGPHLMVGAAPPSRGDELELTLAVGSASRRKRREDSGTPSGSDGGGRSPTSSLSMADTGGSPCQTVMASRLQQDTSAMKQQQSPPWLVQCLGLRMA